MSIYPSLEDMQVDKIIQAQQNAFAQIQAQQQQLNSPSAPAYTMNPYPELNQTAGGAQTSAASNEIYPGLKDFMGLELSQDVIAANMPEYLANSQVAIPAPNDIVEYPSASISRLSGMVAPLTGTTTALQKAQVTNGIRELILCKGSDKKVGLRVKDINKGIFVSIVVKGSPAAMAGLRFGDQILQINGKIVAGYSIDDIHSLLKKSQLNNISIIVRDRPFERAITLHKDSKGRIGFQFNNGKIYSIVKDSSAAKNGMLIDHQILEINGQNVVGMKDKEITQVIDQSGQVVVVTIIPSFIYDHMVKKLSSSFIRGIMDHSTPADF